MQKPETLVILSPGFPVSETDTTCLPLQQMLIRSIKQNYPALNIVVLTFEYPFIKSTYPWFGIKVIAFAGKNRKRLYRILNWLRIWRVLLQLNRQHKVIGLLSFWFDECALLGHYFAKKYKLKHFSWLLGQDAKPGNRYFKLIKPKAESLVAISDAVRRTVYKNYGIMPLHTITAGIDTGVFKPESPVRDIDILGAGSLIPLKQYHLFINAVKLVSRYMPAVRAVICGKGPQKAMLQNLITANGLDANVILQDEVQHGEVAALMKRAKVFLHPSAYEGFSGVILEALYGGAHVVSFVKPMDRVMAHHHIVKDPEEMSSTLFELLLDEHLNHESVLDYPIALTADSIMRLFITTTPQPAQSAGQLH